MIRCTSVSMITRPFFSMKVTEDSFCIARAAGLSLALDRTKQWRKPLPVPLLNFLAVQSDAHWPRIPSVSPSETEMYFIGLTLLDSLGDTQQGGFPRAR